MKIFDTQKIEILFEIIMKYYLKLLLLLLLLLLLFIIYLLSIVNICNNITSTGSKGHNKVQTKSVYLRSYRNVSVTQCT